MPPRRRPEAMRRKAVFYVLLGLATFGLSEFLGAWRAWRAIPTLAGGGMVAVLGLAVLGAMLALGFLLYEVDRAAGRVRHRIWIYERALAWRGEGRRPGLVGPRLPAAEPGKRGG
jgi:hypothetical protein